MEEPTQDYQAIARLKRGDLCGLDALMELYQLQAVRAAYLVVQDRQAAEDIVQNAFLRLAQRIHRFDAARPFAPWFLRSVINDALKAVKRQKRQVSLDEASAQAAAALIETLTDPQPGPEDLAERADTRRAVWRALGALPPDQRAAVVYRYYLGYSESEMSDQMQRPAGTVKWLLHVARQQLHGFLSAFAPPGASPSPAPGPKSPAPHEQE